MVKLSLHTVHTYIHTYIHTCIHMYVSNIRLTPNIYNMLIYTHDVKYNVHLTNRQIFFPPIFLVIRYMYYICSICMYIRMYVHNVHTYSTYSNLYMYVHAPTCIVYIIIHEL